MLGASEGEMWFCAVEGTGEAWIGLVLGYLILGDGKWKRLDVGMAFCDVPPLLGLLWSSIIPLHVVCLQQEENQVLCRESRFI